ncbi:MAG: hypothetical protein HUU38_19420, partial [Anaerolineales bacterium]|nr:hypothetical protein [Anaerolineales bacterium]
QVRLYGLLSLLRKFNDRTNGPSFIDKLRYHIEALQQIESVDLTERMSNEEMTYIVERGSVRVVIFFSICGGSGSGMSFDLAYLCRHLLSNITTNITAVALLPPVMDRAIKNETHTQWEKIRANAYAWLKEHDYLLDHPTWLMNYPEGAPVRVQAPPFDLTFLLDIGNQGGDRLSSEDDIFNMAAQAVFLDTGSPIAGALRGFNANVSVLQEEYQGRRRAYSSLAAASLIYPAEKVLGHASARLAQAALRQGFLATPNDNEVQEATSALLGRLALRDAELLDRLMADRQIPNLNAPTIRKTTSVSQVRDLLDKQRARDDQELTHQIKGIGEQGAEVLAQALHAVENEVASLIWQRGLRFAKAVLDALIAEPRGYEGIPETTLSLLGLKTRLVQQGLTELDVSQASKEYEEVRQRFLQLEGDLLQSVYRTVLKKAWTRDFENLRGECLHWLGEINARTLQLNAQRQISNLYDQLIAHIRYLLTRLTTVENAAQRTHALLETWALENVRPAGLEKGIYELSLEAVDATYICNYYTRRVSGLNPEATYLDFMGKLGEPVLSTLLNLDEADWAHRMISHCNQVFAPELARTSILEALSEYYGEQAPAVIAGLFDRLVRYCHPFWQYNKDSGIQGQEGKSLIGLEDEHSPLVPMAYRDNIQYEIKSTGFKHRIDAARIYHGLPAFLLRGMADYKAYYDNRRNGSDPLHVIPEAAQADEVIPEENVEARHSFAVATAFGYIIQIGTWYYFDAGKRYASDRIHPGRENRLAQGRANAEDAFAHREDFVRQVEAVLETSIEYIGNREAITILQKQIDIWKTALANMGEGAMSENGLRHQYEKEIQALRQKQLQLGWVQGKE